MLYYNETSHRRCGPIKEAQTTSQIKPPNAIKQTQFPMETQFAVAQARILTLFPFLFAEDMRALIWLVWEFIQVNERRLACHVPWVFLGNTLLNGAHPFKHAWVHFARKIYLFSLC